MTITIIDERPYGGITIRAGDHIVKGNDLEETLAWVKQFDTNATERFYLGPFAAGAGYVGPSAAADQAHVQDLFNDLVRHWREGTTGLVES